MCNNPVCAMCDRAWWLGSLRGSRAWQSVVLHGFTGSYHQDLGHGLRATKALSDGSCVGSKGGCCVPQTSVFIFMW